MNQSNPMNRLVPYLDLFGRLADAELGRLAGVPSQTAAQLRTQVDAVCEALARFADLLPRLHDAELMRLTGASAKTVRFWRLCQPRPSPATAAAQRRPAVPRAVETAGSAPPSRGDPSAAPPQPAIEADRPVRVAEAIPPAAAEPPGPVAPPRPVEPPRKRATGTHAAASDRPRGPSEASGERTVAARAPVAEGDSKGLGVGGAPFPGYDFDPNEAAALDKDDDGIVIGLELPEPGA